MKRFVKSIFLMLLVVFIFFGCNKNSVFYGKWEVKEYRIVTNGQVYYYTISQVSQLTYYEELPENADTQQKIEYCLACDYKYGNYKLVFNDNGEYCVEYRSGDISEYEKFIIEESRIVAQERTPDGYEEKIYDHKDNLLVTTILFDDIVFEILFEKMN